MYYRASKQQSNKSIESSLQLLLSIKCMGCSSCSIKTARSCLHSPFFRGFAGTCGLGFHPVLRNLSQAPLLLWQKGLGHEQRACLHCSFPPFFVPPLADDSTVLLQVDNAAELLPVTHAFIHSINQHFKSMSYVESQGGSSQGSKEFIH